VPTVVEADAVLLPATGSGVDDVTVALSEIAPGGVPEPTRVAMTTMVGPLAGAIVPSSHSTCLDGGSTGIVTSTQLPDPVVIVADVKSTAPGRTSTSLTPAAVDGPALLTLTV
jgi:hypothetical protein